MARTEAQEADTALRVVLDVHRAGLTDEQFFHLCRDNLDFRFELTGDGELIVMTPTNPNTGRKNSRVIQRLANWTETDGNGECFDSSSVFTLADGSKRSPDAAWIRKDRWQALDAGEKERFSRICPDFVVELRSPSDRPADLESKMEAYIAQGVQLGWLLDPIDNRATIYRSGEEPRRVKEPGVLEGDPILPGFRFDFREILG